MRSELALQVKSLVGHPSQNSPYVSLNLRNWCGIKESNLSERVGTAEWALASPRCRAVWLIFCGKEVASPEAESRITYVKSKEEKS